MTPLYFLWEKLLGTHQARYIVRVGSRIPVVLVIWFLAVAFPFFGPINSILGALTTTFATYLLPVTLYLITYRTKEVRDTFRILRKFFLIVWPHFVLFGRAYDHLRHVSAARRPLPDYLSDKSGEGSLPGSAGCL